MNCMPTLLAYLRERARLQAIADEEQRLNEAAFLAALDWTEAQVEAYQSRVRDVNERLFALA